MHGMIKTGKRQIATARNVWAMCRGPGTELIATCRRLKWVVKDAVTIITDDGKVLQPHLDPPAAIAIQVKLAVKRWRWRNLGRTLPQLAKGGSGSGTLMAPVWKELKSKQNDEEWNPACRGASKSALAGRQYPQTRVFAAGWSEHNRCILCLYDIVQADAAKNGTAPRSVVEGNGGIQARSWCSHEGSSTITGSNDHDLSSCEVVNRSTVASVTGNGSKTEQKDKSELLLPPMARSTEPPSATATTGYGSAKLSHSKGRDLSGLEKWTGRKKHRATSLATQLGKEA